MAVFFTPTMISGIPSMKYSPLAAWNFAAGAAYAPPAGPPAYGTGNCAGTA